MKAAIEDTNDWLQANQDADKEAHDDKMKELQEVCDPIIAKVYQT